MVDVWNRGEEAREIGAFFERDGMIDGVRGAGQFFQWPANRRSLPSDGIEEEVGFHLSRTARIHENPMRLQHVQAEAGELTVRGQRPAHLIARFGEGRRIQNHHIESPALFGPSRKMIERVSVDEAMRCCLNRRFADVELHIAPGGFERRTADIQADDNKIIAVPSDRFNRVQQWYLETDRQRKK